MAATKNLVVLSVNAAIIAGLRLVIQMGGPIATDEGAIACG